MATKRESRPAFPVVLLTDAQTGRKVFVNSLWMRSFGEGESGTVITYSNGDTLTADEDFRTAEELFGRGFSDR